MNKTLTPLIAAVILSLTIGSVAIAEPTDGNKKPPHCEKTEMKGHHPMNMGFPHKPFFLKGIELTAEQEDKIFELTHAEAPKLRARMKAQQDLRQDLIIMIQTNNFDENKARKIADKLAKIESENTLAKAHIDNSLMNLLTPEQREKVIKNKKEFRLGHNRATPTAHHQRFVGKHTVI